MSSSNFRAQLTIERCSTNSRRVTSVQFRQINGGNCRDGRDADNRAGMRTAIQPQPLRLLLGARLATVIVAGHDVSTTVAAACDALNIPTVAIERCVIPGAQTDIDAGHVVRVDDLSTATVHWLAGHRTTRSGTFGALPDVQLGDIVEYRDLQYQIVEYSTARFDSPGAVLAWIDSTTPTVILQTSRDSMSAHLWRGEALLASADAPAADRQAAV